MFVKKIAAGALLSVSVQAAPSDKTLTEEKRYSQLIALMDHFNPTFDERQYWTYGCNCLMLGDRPMTDPGKGKPVDELDTVCKQYKDCLKCASMAHGDTCIGEFVKYRINMNGAQPVCKDNAGSCARDLCECDRIFAQEHVAVSNVYNEDYHMFYTKTGWNAETDCLKGSGGLVDPQCCGADDGPKAIYNTYTKVCCADGTIKTDQSECAAP